jgi:uncharacterized membrane protein
VKQKSIREELLRLVRLKAISRVLVGLLFITAGVLHFIKAGFFVSIVPAFLPFPAALVYISGVCEILGGIGALIPWVRRPAGYGLIALLLAVFPANINMLVQSIHDHGWSSLSILLILRLPLQFALIALVNWLTKAGP